MPHSDLPELSCSAGPALLGLARSILSQWDLPGRSRGEHAKPHLEQIPPLHPFLQHFSRGNSTPSGLPCSCEGVIEPSNTDIVPKAKRKSSCGTLTHVSIQIPFLSRDQETHGLTPLILSLQRGPGSQGLCSFTRMQSSAAPNPRCFHSYSSRYPGPCWEQISIPTGHVKELDQFSHPVPWPSAV